MRAQAGVRLSHDSGAGCFPVPPVDHHDRSKTDHVGQHRTTAMAHEGQGDTHNRSKAHDHHEIDRDIEEEENVEKVAEYVEAGQIMARSFVEEISQSEEEGK